VLVHGVHHILWETLALARWPQVLAAIVQAVAVDVHDGALMELLALAHCDKRMDRVVKCTLIVEPFQGQTPADVPRLQLTLHTTHGFDVIPPPLEDGHAILFHLQGSSFVVKTFLLLRRRIDPISPFANAHDHSHFLSVLCT
jgi:hypothetical protein